MSNYDRLSSLESQPTTTRREEYSDDPDFAALASHLSDRLFSLTSIVSKLATQVSLLGTRRETERVRERVREFIEEGARGFKEAGESLKKAWSWEEVSVSPFPTASCWANASSNPSASPAENSTASSKPR
jgi:hypothetical protein